MVIGVQDYSSSITYNIGDLAKSGGYIYECYNPTGIGFTGRFRLYSPKNEFALNTPTASTASTVFVDLPGNTFTITNPGNYMVFFSVQISNTNNDIGAFFQLQKNGVDVTGASCAGNTHPARQNEASFSFYLTSLVAGNVIKMQFRTAANTLTATTINFNIVKL